MQRADFPPDGSHIIAEGSRLTVITPAQEKLIILEGVLTDTQPNGAAETTAWKEWTQINAHPELSEPPTAVDFNYGKTQKRQYEVAIGNAARVSAKYYKTKPNLSWKAAVEWARLCTEADSLKLLDEGVRDKYVNTHDRKEFYLRTLSAPVKSFCAEGIAELVADNPRLVTELNKVRYLY